MPDSAGTYSLAEPVPENGQTGDATPIAANLEDIEAALTARVLANGTKTYTADQPMGGFNHTGVANANARTEYAATGQVADGALTYGGVAGGTADVITIAPSPAIEATYVIGAQFRFKVGAAANTGAVTLNVNSRGAGAVTWPDGSALVAGDLPANAMAVVVVQATTPVFHLQTPMRTASRTFADPGHRLSLTTALAVTTADVTAAGTVYWTPGKSNLSPIYNGSAWVMAAVAQLQFILDATNMLADKNFDVLLDYNAGTPRLVLSPAWTNDTTRADALGVDATYGFVVNNASMTVRITNNGGTATLAAKAGLYVGSIRTSANGQTEDSAAKRFVWNMYNRAPRFMRVLESTDSWTYTTATIRQARATATNQLDFLIGLSEDIVTAFVFASWANDNIGTQTRSLIGLDATNAMATGCILSFGQEFVANQTANNNAEWMGFPGIGRHFLAWLEYSQATGTTTWVGDGGSPTLTQSGIHGEVWA